MDLLGDFEAAHDELVYALDLAGHHEDMVADAQLLPDIRPAGAKGRAVPQVRVLHMLSGLGIVARPRDDNLPNHAGHPSSLNFEPSFCLNAFPWCRARTPSCCSLPTTMPGPIPICSAKASMASLVSFPSLRKSPSALGG